MAKQISFNHIDTAISGVTSNTTPIGLVNFGADWRTESKTADEVVMTNMRSPIGMPERIRVRYSRVADIYKDSNIEPSNRAQSRSGLSVFIQHTDISSVTDTVDATFLVQMPFSEQVTIKVPCNEYVTDTFVLAYLQRSLAAWFETGDHTALRLSALLRGGLLPVDMK